jgi:hypothetical protein
MPYSHPLNENTFITHWTNPTNPAAGAEKAFTLPIPAQGQLTLLSFSFAADANPANRIFTITLETGGSTIILGSADAAITANQTMPVICHENAPLTLQTPLYTLLIALPSLRIFDPTAQIKINVASIQAGDQISDIYSYWKLWRGV